MKFKLYTFALLALLVASCERNLDIPEPEKSEEKIVTISAIISPETRVTYTESTRALSWEAGDKLILAGYDDGNNYKGNYTFTWTGNGNQFSGRAVVGATKYKAYYNPAEAITLDGNGNVQLSATFWQQTQNGDNTTGHLENGLLLFDESFKTIGQNFNLSMKSSIIKWTLNNIPTDAAQGPKQLIWTAETATGAQSMVLNLIGLAPGTTSLTVFLAFDPTVMKITTGGKAMITLNVNNKLYQWSQTVAGGKDYNAGNRYTGTISGNWELMVNPLSYVAKFNVNETGDDFVTDETLCTDVGYFAWETAIANYHTVNTITGYHLPRLEEWCSISPRYYNGGTVHVVFNETSSYDNIAEEVIVQGQTYNMTCDYRNRGSDQAPAPAYALRYKGVDNMRSAWRYEYIYDQYLARTYLKITSRNVAPTVNIDHIISPTFWNSNKNNDIVRLFPAVGHMHPDYPTDPTKIVQVGTDGTFLAFFTHQEGQGPIENLPTAWHFSGNSMDNWDPQSTIDNRDSLGGAVFAVRLFLNP